VHWIPKTGPRNTIGRVQVKTDSETGFIQELLEHTGQAHAYHTVGWNTSLEHAGLASTGLPFLSAEVSRGRTIKNRLAFLATGGGPHRRAPFEVRLLSSGDRDSSGRGRRE